MILNKPLVRLTTAHYQSAVSMISFAQVLTVQCSDTIPCQNVQFQVGVTSHDILFQQELLTNLFEVIQRCFGFVSHQSIIIDHHWSSVGHQLVIKLGTQDDQLMTDDDQQSQNLVQVQKFFFYSPWQPLLCTKTSFVKLVQGTRQSK